MRYNIVYKIEQGINKRKNSMSKNRKSKSIESVTEAIASKGTRIVSFDYDGKSRNVLLGAMAADDYPAYGQKVNPILTVHQGKKYIAGVDNNDGRQVKVFSVDKIRNPSW